MGELEQKLSHTEQKPCHYKQMTTTPYHNKMAIFLLLHIKNGNNC